MSRFTVLIVTLSAFTFIGCGNKDGGGSSGNTSTGDGGGGDGGGGGGGSIALDAAYKKFHFTVSNLSTRAAAAPSFASFPAAGSPTIDTSSLVTALAEPAEPTETVTYNTTKLGTVTANVLTAVPQNSSPRTHSVLIDTDATTCTTSMDLTCAINGGNAKLLDLTAIVTTAFTASTSALALTVNGVAINATTQVNTYTQAQNHDTTYNQRFAREAVALGDYIYFNGWNLISGSETTALFRVHRTTYDTNVVLNANPGFGTKADTSHLTVFNNALYFRARTDGLTSYKLIKYDPGTDTLSQISSATTLLNPRNFHVYNSNMYFFADNASGYTKLYRMNTSGGIKQMTNLCATASEGGLKFLSTSTALYVSLISPARCGDAVKRWIISRVNSDDSLTPLHYYDSGSTFLIDDGLNEVVYFNSKNYISIGVSGILYRDDGATLYRAISYDPFARPTTPVSGLSVVGSYLYYKVASNANADGTGVFRYDPNTGTIQQLNVDNIVPDVKMIRSFNNKLYVSMKDSGNHQKLYRLDTNDSFTRISNLNSGAGDDIISPYLYNSELYFLGKVGGSYQVHKLTTDDTLHQVTNGGTNDTLLGTSLGLILSSTSEDAIRVVQ